MEDLNFLHNSFEGKHTTKSADSKDEIESFGLNPKIIIVEDDKVLGLSIKKYLMKTLECDVELFTSSMDCLAHLFNLPNNYFTR